MVWRFPDLYLGWLIWLARRWMLRGAKVRTWAFREDYVLEVAGVDFQSDLAAPIGLDTYLLGGERVDSREPREGAIEIVLSASPSGLNKEPKAPRRS